MFYSLASDLRFESTDEPPPCFEKILIPFLQDKNYKNTLYVIRITCHWQLSVFSIRHDVEEFGLTLLKRL